MQIYRDLYENGEIPKGWEKPFKDGRKDLLHPCTIIEKDRIKYTPNDPFYALRLIEPKNVRVVIFGQAPYPKGANGLAFSSDTGVQKSQNTIFTELENTIDGFKRPDHGDLSCWCKQGVLLLNAAPVTKAGEMSYKSEIWMGFLGILINFLISVNKNMIWVIWGKVADKAVSEFIKENGKAFRAPHPSPANIGGGFLGCRHFVKINKYLRKIGQEPIDWTIYENNVIELPDID